MSGTASVLNLPAVLTHAVASDFTIAMAKDVTGGHGEIVVDASALKQFDSSALAVLLECRRLALAAGRDFSVWNAPARLLQLANVYGVEELIPAAQSAPSR